MYTRNAVYILATWLTIFASSVAFGADDTVSEEHSQECEALLQANIKRLSRAQAKLAIGHGYFGQRLHNRNRSAFWREVYAPNGMPSIDLATLKPHTQNIFDQRPIGPGAPTDIRNQINSGAVLPSVFFVTHQDPLLQMKTVKVLREPRFSNVPRVFLVSELCNSTRFAFRNEASFILYSDSGAFDMPIVANTVYLAGGYDNLCLKQTVQKVIERALTIGLNEITLHAFPNLMYYLDATSRPDKLTDFINPFNSEKLVNYLPISFLRFYSGKMTFVPGTVAINGNVWSADFKFEDSEMGPEPILIHVKLER